MKKTVTVGIGGRNLVIDEDACTLLGTYLDSYSASLVENRKEIMEGVEARFADLLRESLGGMEVVNAAMVEAVAARMGMTRPCGQTAGGFEGSFCGQAGSYCERQEIVRKFFRDTDDRKIGGVCSGLALYFNVDVVLIRVVFLAALLFATAGFWIYIIVCIAAPSAHTPAEKCQMRGIPCTPENLSRFTDTRK